MDQFESIVKNVTNGTGTIDVSECANQLRDGEIEVGMSNYYLWQDGKTHLLPEDFSLDPSISPLLLWQQWHRGFTYIGGRTISPLREVPPKDYPASSRTFKRMRVFCRAVDSVISTTGKESIAMLNRMYAENAELLKEKGILLSSATPCGRKRTRGGELSWNYFAERFEHRRRLLSKAARNGVSLAQVVAEEKESTTARKKREREARKKTRDESIAEQGRGDLSRLPAGNTDEVLPRGMFDVTTRGRADRLFR